MNKIIVPVACLLTLLNIIDISAHYVINQNTVDYYTNLIQTELDKASTYIVPDNGYSYKPTTNSITEYGTYDYIIIGAGSAGSVIANRLSEIKSNKILLLEAGGEENDFSDIPAMCFPMQGTDFSWNYTTVPQLNSCLGAINQTCPYPRGKGLGGTSLINGLMYVRGNKIDYDRWHAQGNPGWSYDEVLPYFKKSEDSHIEGDPGYHGNGGYLNINYANPISDQALAFINANMELGQKYLNYNGEEQLGVSRTQFTLLNGRRLSLAKAFLRPAANRTNLDIQTYAYVIKININPTTKIATSVLFVVGGTIYCARVNKEIVLSAGAIASPQLLMLSGIGPPQHLKELNIPVVQPLAVGNNLQEHAAFLPLHFETNFSIPVKSMEEYVIEYLNEIGPYTKPANLEALAFFETTLNKVPGRPDIEIIAVTSNNTNPIFRKVLNLEDETYNSIWVPVDPTKSFSIFISLLHPKSRGYVKLYSSNPFEYPEINPNFFTDPDNEDIETVYRGIQLALQLTTTNAFKQLNVGLLKLIHPRCESYKYLSKDFWYCQIKQLGFHLYHPVGTCKMGPNPLQGDVVNHELKVHGINGLRVADCSIIPEAASAHTNAVAVMIGEKAAQMIKDDNYHHETVQHPY